MLVVGDTPIPEDALHLARNLDRLFPSLQRVYAGLFNHRVGVGKLVRALQAVRAEEKAH